MDNVFRNEKYVVENVKVNIFIQGNSDYFEKSKLREAILEFHKENDLCQKFPEIIYQFTSEEIDKKKEISGDMWINDDVLAGKRAIININNNSGIINYNVKQIKIMLLHELTHIWYYRCFRVSKSISDAVKNTSEFMKKKIKPFIEEFHDVRKGFAEDFITNLLIEGIAEYVSRLKYDDATLDEETFNILYESALESSADLRRKIFSYENKHKGIIHKIFPFIKIQYGSLIKKFGHSSYDVGRHMVHAILFIDKKLTIEDVCNMNHLSFIKKYEACMNLIGKQPVVSLTSEKGILDYKHILEILHSIYLHSTHKQ